VPGADHARDPEDGSLRIAHHRPPPALVARDLPVDQDLLELLFPSLAEWQDPVAGPQRTDAQRETEPSEIENLRVTAQGDPSRAGRRHLPRVLHHHPPFLPAGRLLRSGEAGFLVPVCKYPPVPGLHLVGWASRANRFIHGGKEPFVRGFRPEAEADLLKDPDPQCRRQRRKRFAAEREIAGFLAYVPEDPSRRLRFQVIVQFPETLTQHINAFLDLLPVSFHQQRKEDVPDPVPFEPAIAVGAIVPEWD
jgi:hypothetical protein